MKRIAMIAALLGLTIPVRADISDTGDLLIGGQGVVQGTMTVVGSSLAVNGVPYGWPSSQGAADQVLTNDGTGNLSWSDGGAVLNSTSAVITFSGVSNDKMGPCVAGSTLTISGSRFTVGFSGAIRSQSGSTGARWGFLVDGDFPTGLSSTVGVSGGLINATYGMDIATFTGEYEDLSLTDGSHTFCFTVGVAWSGGNSIQDYGNSRELFYVESF